MNPQQFELVNLLSLALGLAIEERFSVLLEARAEGRGQCWRGAGHSMAWTGGLVDLSFAHEIEAD
jgi:hypothetical protein